jgi:hypothetical protein
LVSDGKCLLCVVGVKDPPSRKERRFFFRIKNRGAFLINNRTKKKNRGADGTTKRRASLVQYGTPRRYRTCTRHR